MDQTFLVVPVPGGWVLWLVIGTEANFWVPDGDSSCDFAWPFQPVSNIHWHYWQFKRYLTIPW